MLAIARPRSQCGRSACRAQTVFAIRPVPSCLRVVCFASRLVRLASTWVSWPRRHSDATRHRKQGKLTPPGDSDACWCRNGSHDPVLSLLLEHDLWQVPKHHPHRKIAPALPCRHRLDAHRSGEACSSHCPGNGMEPPFTVRKRRQPSGGFLLAGSCLSTRGQLGCSALEDVGYPRHEILHATSVQLCSWRR